MIKNQTHKASSPYKLKGSFIKMDKTIDGIVKGLSTKQAMLQGGYTESYANSSTQFMQKKRVQDKLRDIVSEIKTERDKALELMKAKRSDASYSDLLNSTEKLTKLVQLLEGNPTERLEIEGIEQDIRSIAKQ